MKYNKGDEAYDGKTDRKELDLIAVNVITVHPTNPLKIPIESIIILIHSQTLLYSG